jgi:hypothetical protein
VGLARAHARESGGQLELLTIGALEEVGNAQIGTDRF